MANKSKFYADHFVGEDLLRKADTMINDKTVFMWSEEDAYGPKERWHNPKRDIARDEYARLELNYFGNKAAMKEHLQEYDNNFWNKHNLDDYWEQYLKRDRLIAAGVYEKARQEVYSDNYLTNAAMYMGNDKDLKVITDNLKGLSVEEFNALTKPQADRDSVTTALPSIQEFYGIASVKGQADAYEDFIGRFKRAFDEAGLKWKEAPLKEDYIVDELTERDLGAYEQHKPEIFKQLLKSSPRTDVYARTLKTVYRSSPKNVRDAIARESSLDFEDIFSERREALNALRRKEEDLLARGKALIYVTKTGELYIPFVKKDIMIDYLKKYYGK